MKKKSYVQELTEKYEVDSTVDELGVDKNGDIDKAKIFLKYYKGHQYFAKPDKDGKAFTLQRYVPVDVLKIPATETGGISKEYWEEVVLPYLNSFDEK